MSVVAQPAPCTISPADKRLQAKRVGDDLLRNYGKRNFYSVEQVRESNRRAGVKTDVACWSHAMFNSHSEFDRLHASTGEACDYIAMKGEMLLSVTSNGSSGWFDFDLSWLDFPDLDISIFDFFDW